MFTNFDCDCFFVADRSALIGALGLIVGAFMLRGSRGAAYAAVVIGLLAVAGALVLSLVGTYGVLAGTVFAALIVALAERKRGAKA